MMRACSLLFRQRLLSASTGQNAPCFDVNGKFPTRALSLPRKRAVSLL